jgi:hypothetical protein
MAQAEQLMHRSLTYKGPSTLLSNRCGAAPRDVVAIEFGLEEYVKRREDIGLLTKADVVGTTSVNKLWIFLDDASSRNCHPNSIDDPTVVLEEHVFMIFFLIWKPTKIREATTASSACTSVTLLYPQPEHEFYGAALLVLEKPCQSLTSCRIISLEREHASNEQNGSSKKRREHQSVNTAVNGYVAKNQK